MEAEPQLSRQIMINDEVVEVGDEEEFYEKIEAPKFFDLTVPDLYRPDDRYWFCLRVGCDQKHEEEIDPEAINKNFILRVMAARSPNIRLRKALNRKPPSTNMKCPQSAPAKSSKPRVSRLALISSISQKAVDPKGKVRPLPKINSKTPNVGKTKEVSAKYLTTPRNKKCLPNPNSFRSVQNPKPTVLEVPKNRMVKKALVFNSPKKGICVKTSSELRTPLTKICEGIKRLEISSQRKRVLGYSTKSSKEIRRDPYISSSLNPSRRRLSTRKGKNRAKDSLHSQKSKDREAKSLKRVEGKEIVETDSSDMEIDGKSRCGSVLDSSRINEGNGNEAAIPSKTENAEAPSDDSGSGNEIPKLQVLNGEVDEGRKGNEKEERKSSLENGIGSKDDPNENEVMDNDDKENALAFDDNRNFNQNNHHSENKILGSGELCESTKKVTQKMYKNLKEELASAGVGAQGVKYRKPRPTNPKPFRLRTDERGILREANLERKYHFLAPHKEIATVSRIPGGNSQRSDGHDVQKNEKCIEESKCSNHTDERSENELETNVQNDESQRIKTPKLATPQRHSASKHKKTTLVISQLGDDKVNVNQNSDNRLRKTKSPSLQRQLVRPQGVGATKKAVNPYIKPGQKLGVIEETSSPILRPKEEGKPGEGGAPPATKSSSRGKRPATIPKEPNFHSIHVPKSCTRKVA